MSNVVSNTKIEARDSATGVGGPGGIGNNCCSRYFDFFA